MSLCFPVPMGCTLTLNAFNSILVIYCCETNSPNLVAYSITILVALVFCESVVQKGHRGNVVPQDLGLK